MQAIVLKPLFHRGQEQIGIFFLNNKETNNAVRKIRAIKWSQTNKCWYAPLSKESYQNICAALKNIASIGSTELKAYLEKRKTIITVKKNSGQKSKATLEKIKSPLDSLDL